MTLFRTVAPDAEPVTVAELKAHLRIDGSQEDGLLGDLIRTARSEVEQATGCALLSQDWRLILDAWPVGNCVLLRCSPVREILAVTVYGADGGATVLDPAQMLLDGVSRPARLLFEAPPQPEQALNGIEIDFRAGFGEAATDVPDLLKRAIVVLAGHWFEFRASFAPSDQPVSYPPGYERLVAPFRQRRL
jgi:uncharacterized phiE125 gp8 family phage protein